jgi:hypothetical protein
MKRLLNIPQPFTENSFKSKLKLVGRFECAVDIVGKPLMSTI